MRLAPTNTPQPGRAVSLSGCAVPYPSAIQRANSMNCPNCDRLLYSRQHKTCGFCGAELSSEVRLSDEEIAAMKAEQEAIAVRRAIAKAEEEAAARAAQAAREEKARRRRLWD